jgi:nucleotide-binding universal stress UspA family protein
MKRMRRIFYASDFSREARAAFNTAVALAASLDARLTIVHVLTPLVPTVPEQYLDAVMIDRLERQTGEWSARQAARLRADAEKAGVRAVVDVRRGDPAEQIVRAARGGRADLLVVGTHGRRGMQKFLLGSVAERVLAAAPCPVLTVRGR